ncbi:hypothetical protein ACWEKT_40870 [Nocardia takedensis]|uniref:hypothetical protein n=1 Tax=Nocardia takedensis TaxID=259390 RepID=UPI001FDF752F|nr:hypothetical protein [Nocardia takedensis]
MRLSANTAAAVLREFRPRTLSDRIRLDLCKDLIADVRRLDRQLSVNQAEIDRLLDEHGTRLHTTTASDRYSRPD